MFELFPNPAKDYFTLSYDIGSSGEGTLTLNISDAQGRNMHFQDLKNVQDQLLISTEAYLPGIYLLTIFEGSRHIHSQTLTIY